MVTKSRANKGYPEWQAIRPKPGRYGTGGHIQQINKVGVGAKHAVGSNRLRNNLLPADKPRSSGEQHDIKIRPHPVRHLFKQVLAVNPFKHIGCGIAGRAVHDGANGWVHICTMCVIEVRNGGQALHNKRTTIEQLGCFL